MSDGTSERRKSGTAGPRPSATLDDIAIRNKKTGLFRYMLVTEQISAYTCDITGTTHSGVSG